LAAVSGEYTSKTEALLGADAQARLGKSCGVVFGTGGVGSWCAEALIRTGVGKLVLVDDDTVAPSNVNRQRQAIPATVGERKVEALKRILLAISPEAEIVAVCRRYTPETAEEFATILQNADFVIDAIDSVDCKADLMARCDREGMPPLFCSMGAALRTDPTRIRTSPFPEVAGDGLAKALRNRLRKAGISFPRHACVHSTEVPAECNERASLMQVTCAFGMALAALAVKAVAAR
jgi:tRNA A37 threonylcarbamoyladenosine dehydratase